MHIIDTCVLLYSVVCVCLLHTPFPYFLNSALVYIPLLPNKKLTRQERKSQAQSVFSQRCFVRAAAAFPMQQYILSCVILMLSGESVNIYKALECSFVSVAVVVCFRQRMNCILWPGTCCVDSIWDLLFLVFISRPLKTIAVRAIPRTSLSQAVRKSD